MWTVIEMSKAITDKYSMNLAIFKNIFVKLLKRDQGKSNDLTVSNTLL